MVTISSAACFTQQLVSSVVPRRPMSAWEQDYIIMLMHTKLENGQQQPQCAVNAIRLQFLNTLYIAGLCTEVYLVSMLKP